MTSVIHMLLVSRKILNFLMYMLGCKVALEQDLSIGAIFRRKSFFGCTCNFEYRTKRHVVIPNTPTRTTVAEPGTK
jgi:hypothetical protein